MNQPDATANEFGTTSRLGDIEVVIFRGSEAHYFTLDSGGEQTILLQTAADSEPQPATIEQLRALPLSQPIGLTVTGTLNSISYVRDTGSQAPDPGNNDGGGPPDEGTPDEGGPGEDTP